VLEDFANQPICFGAHTKRRFSLSDFSFGRQVWLERSRDAMTSTLRQSGVPARPMPGGRLHAGSMYLAILNCAKACI
jgi:hypothetical protein